MARTMTVAPRGSRRPGASVLQGNLKPGEDGCQPARITYAAPVRLASRSGGAIRNGTVRVADLSPDQARAVRVRVMLRTTTTVPMVTSSSAEMV